MSEEINVVFQASLLGRTDIIQNVLSQLRGSGKSPIEISSFLSTIRPEDHASPLHISASNGHSDSVRALLNGGANIDYRPTSGPFAGKTPYEIATESVKQSIHAYLFEQIALGNIDSIIFLKEAGVPLDIHDGSTLEDSALHWAISFNHLDVTKYLIHQGCDPNVMNTNKQTPLHLASKYNNVDIVSLLLSEGSNVDVVDKDGNSPQDMTTDASILALLNKNIEENNYIKPSHSLDELEKEIIQEKLLLEKAEKLIENIPSNNHIPAEIQPLPTPSEPLPEKSNPQNVLLVFWPPVSYQHSSNNNDFLVLSTLLNLNISLFSQELDLFPVINSSGFLDILDQYGFQVQVKRSHTDSCIKFIIDKHISPIPNSYHLQITQQMIVLTACDQVGLLYGIYTLIQLIQLHSIQSKSVDNLTTLLKIPLITIIDKPQIMNRSILWSYRQFVGLQLKVLQDYIQLLSKLKINRLNLLIDTQTMFEKQISEEQEKEIANTLLTLDDACTKYCIELIPTIVINSIHDNLPEHFLQSILSPMLSIIFTIDKTTLTQELQTSHKHVPTTNNNNGEEQFTEEQLIHELFQKIFSQVVSCGFFTLFYSCTQWLKTIDDPLSIALSKGIRATERDFSTDYPSSLFTKPLVSIQDYICSLDRYITKVERLKSFSCTFPAFTDRDFWFPMILIKYFSFMYAGLAWNQLAVKDMLGDFDANTTFDANIIKDMINWFLFPAQHQENINTTQYQTLISILTDDIQQFQHNETNENNTHVNNATEEDHSNHQTSSTLPSHDLALLEKSIWSFAVASNINYNSVVPTKWTLLQSIKIYKKIILSSKWEKMYLFSKSLQPNSFWQFVGLNYSLNATNNNTNKSNYSLLEIELEEYYCVLNVMMTTMKAILLSWNAYQKLLEHPKPTTTNSSPRNNSSMNNNIALTTPLTYPQILQYLSLGTKSDIANTILELLTNLMKIWNERFERRTITQFHEMIKQQYSPQSLTLQTIQNTHQHLLNTSIHELNKSYILQTQLLLPTNVLFSILCSSLCVSDSLEHLLEKIFL